MKDPLSRLQKVREKLSEMEARMIRESEMIRLLKVQLDQIEADIKKQGRDEK
jgi:hypothetical protein